MRAEFVVPSDGSLRALVKQQISEYEALTAELVKAFLALAQGTSEQTPTPEDVMKRIVEKDAELQLSVNALKQHQRQHQRLMALQEVINSHDRVIFDLTLELQKAENSLEQVLEKANEKLKTIERAEEAAQDPDSLVRYATLTSYSVAPPPNWRDGIFMGPFRSGYPAFGSDVVNGIWFKSHYGISDEEPTAPVAAQIATAEEEKPSAQAEPGAAAAAAAKPEAPVATVEFDDFDSDSD